MQIQRTVWHFHRKHDQSQSRTNSPNPHPKQFLTNIPSQVPETKTLPGLGKSDHDIVFHEIKVHRGRIKENPRQVKSYKKANWSDFKKNLAIFTYTFITHRHKDPNHLWDMFEAEVNRLSILHIPTRQIKRRSFTTLLNTKRQKTGIAPLNSEDQTHTDPVSKANMLNKRFESVFSKSTPLSLKQLAKS